ncbi:hypothetical protein BV20DRAFT_531453 [Pilatotrama ljubarskyi]|nr:hypothetical protein BV20DRAFT_531453 [Pilatotrama ljubarskyi]
MRSVDNCSGRHSLSALKRTDADTSQYNRTAFDMVSYTDRVQVELTRVDGLKNEQKTFHMFLRDGFFLALMNGIPLEELVIVQRRTIIFHSAVDIIDLSQRTPVYFHHPQLDDSLIADCVSGQAPLGFWTTRIEPRERFQQSMPGLETATCT